MNNRKYIVTGGCGFIGSHLIRKLLKLGHKVVVLDDLSTGYESNLPENEKLTFIKVNISDWSELSRLFTYFKNVDGIFHVAARARIQPSIQNPLKTHKSNVDGTFNILEMMRMNDIKKIVYSASSSSYGLKAELPCVETAEPDCLNPYALTKYIGEQYCKTWGNIYDIKNVCLKYFNVYGERSPLISCYAPVVGLFFRQALKDKDSLSIVGDGEQRRDFTHVDDVVEANVLAMKNVMSKDVNGETFNIGTGVNYSINQVAEMVQENLSRVGDMVSMRYVPARPAEARETLADISKAQNLLEWEPTISLPDAIVKLTPYYKHTVR